MNVCVEIAFSFKRELNDAYRTLEIPENSTVLEAFCSLAVLYPAFRERVLDDAGEVRRNIHALVNGRNVQSRQGFATVLRDGDRLTVLPPMGGG